MSTDLRDALGALAHDVPDLGDIEAFEHLFVSGRTFHVALRNELQARGHVFTSQTDTEVMAVLIDEHISAGMHLREAVLATVRELDGAYAIAVLNRDEPDRVVGARRGAPLLVGLGIGENFLGSDAQALIQVTHRMLYLDEGDVVEITRDAVQVYALDGQPVTRQVHESELSADAVERGQYRHYMQKEIFEQPRAISDTLRMECCPTSSASTVTRCWRARAACTSWPAAPATTPAWWPNIGSRRSRDCRSVWKWPANTATARLWCRRIRCLSPFPSPAKLPTRWQDCAKRAGAG